MSKERARVAILGSGKIGIDLMFKIARSPLLECMMVVGRTAKSAGLAVAKENGVRVAYDGINSVLEEAQNIDILIDCTSALAHVRHWQALKDTKITVVDMTPSSLGLAIVPAVNLEKVAGARNINMITCGGQASIPIIHAMSEVVRVAEYVEVVSSIASKSAGPATRINLDEYIQNTESGILRFSGAKHSKVILILNPAEPPVDMQTTISFQVDDPPMEQLSAVIKKKVELMKTYVPGYELLLEPTLIEKNRVVTMVRVVGLGDYLPKYAGNLDIINCAAVAAAEKIAISILGFNAREAEKQHGSSRPSSLGLRAQQTLS